MAKIEWTDITRNPIKGKCTIACPYCYARQMYDDNKWDPTIRFVPEVLDDLPKKPCRVFVGSTIEPLLFREWLPEILARCRQHPEHTFIFLTKKYEELIRYSPFPKNCWVGASATHSVELTKACNALMDIEATVKFVSIEPFIGSFPELTRHYFVNAGVSWVIVGAMTGSKSKMLAMQKHYYYADLRLQQLFPGGRKYALFPRLEKVKDVVMAADDAGARIFIKDNLYKLMMENPILDLDLYWSDMSTLRQEIPGGRLIDA